MTDFRDALLAEWQRREPSRAPRPLLPLIGDSFDHREIIAAVDVLLSGRLTMGDRVRQFEQEFAKLFAGGKDGAGGNCMLISGVIQIGSRAHQLQRFFVRAFGILEPR